MKNVTMRDIGAALGVSTVTISKALGGKEGVSDAVREKIIETARQMGYQYSAPRQDDGGRAIGILIADRFFSAPSFYASLYRALLKELAEVDMLGALEIISDQDEEGLTMPVAMTIQRVSGFVLLGQFATDYVSNVLDTGLPTVLLDFTCDGPDVDAVVSDGQVGCYQLTRYLIDHGHRQIGFVGNGTNDASALDDLEPADRRAAEAQVTISAVQLMRQVRVHAPRALILWAYGMCGDPMKECLKQVVAQLRSEGDDRVAWLSLEGCGSDLGSRGHPERAAHQRAAEQIADALRSL